MTGSEYGVTGALRNHHGVTGDASLLLSAWYVAPCNVHEHIVAITYHYLTQYVS